MEIGEDSVSIITMLDWTLESEILPSTTIVLDDFCAAGEACESNQMYKDNMKLSIIMS